MFVGDNGQGDVRAAEMMAEQYPGSLEAVYMQRVRRSCEGVSIRGIGFCHQVSGMAVKQMGRPIRRVVIPVVLPVLTM